MATLLAHEWLAETGGSENVFEQLRLVFPDATSMCLWNDAPERFDSTIRETWLANSPLRRSKALSLPVLPRVWRSVDLDGFERVVASSHAFSHQLAFAAAKRGIAAYAYVHTPARYVWTPDFDDRGQSMIAKAGSRYLRRVDRARTSLSVSYAANSEFVRQRIHDAWGVPAEVIYPPVDIETVQSGGRWRDRVKATEGDLIDSLPEGFVLGASRFVEYKRLDTAIEVGEVLGRPVVLAGSGPDEERLRERASRSKVPVIFFGRPSDEALYALYQAAALFVFMAIEDFGIMPVEAMALGTPVLVGDVGGARESVETIEGGAIADPRSADGVRSSSDAALAQDMVAARERSRLFSNASYRDAIKIWTNS